MKETSSAAETVRQRWQRALRYTHPVQRTIARHNYWTALGLLIFIASIVGVAYVGGWLARSIVGEYVRIISELAKPMWQ